MQKVTSFDVFDTVVTRVVGSPTSVFILLGSRCKHAGFIRCGAEEFRMARIAAEQSVRTKANGREVTLAEIHEELRSRLGISLDASEHVLQEEMRLEMEMLCPVPQTKQYMDVERGRGRKIIFASDMYLPAGWIQEQLRRHGLLKSEDRCYVSSEIGVAKSTGGLFQTILDCEKLKASAIKHVGNDSVSDVVAPQRVGIRAEPFFEANLNRYERILESYSSSTNGLTSLFAGASRLARLSVPAGNRHERSLRDIAASVAGPTLVAYVMWVLLMAKQAGLRKLYFVSRDGQILLEVAKRIAPRLKVTCELRYLFGSRQAWHLPAMREIGEFELKWILEKYDFLSIRALLKRVALTPEEIAEELNRAGFPKCDWDRDLRYDEIVACGRVLVDKGVCQLILDRAAERRSLVLRYLRQEGVMDSVPCGFVDVGWRGRLLQSLCKMLAAEGGAVPLGFYFGLHGVSDERESGRMLAYFHDARCPTESSRSFSYLPFILETFCAGSHGLVVGYRADDNTISAELKSIHNRRVVNWGLKIVQSTVCCFADKVWLSAGAETIGADARDAIGETLKTFLFRPERLEAKAWASFPYEDSQTGDTFFRFGDPPRIREAIQYLLTGKNAWAERVVWREGAWKSRSLGAAVAWKMAMASRDLPARVKRMGQSLWRQILNDE